MNSGLFTIIVSGVVLSLPVVSEASETEIPPQCYAETVTSGIPVSYARESLIDQPVLLERAEPDYPDQASESSDFYCASFMFSIGPDGKPINIEALYDSHPGIDGVEFGRVAKAALQKWRYQPGLVDKGEAAFLGFSAVFFKGFGETAARYAELVMSGASLVVENDVANDWQSYGKTVTQQELEQLEMASDQQVAPALIAAKVAAKPKKPKQKIANSWIVAEDGSVLIDNKIYRPGDVFEVEEIVEPEPVTAPKPVTWKTTEPVVVPVTELVAPAPKVQGAKPVDVPQPQSVPAPKAQLDGEKPAIESVQEIDPGFPPLVDDKR